MLKRLLKHWKLLLTLLILIPVVLVCIALWMLERMLQPAALTARLESKFNCRVEIGASKAQLWGSPAAVEITGLKLAPRDPDADNALPPDQRQLLSPKSPLLSLDQVNLNLELWPLIRGNLNLKDILVKNLAVVSLTTEKGSNGLQQLFGKPAIVAGKPNPDLQAPTQPSEPPPPATTKTYRAKDLPLATSLNSAALENLTLDVRSEKKKESMQFEITSLKLSDVAMDASRLRNKNHARIDLAGKFILTSKRKLKEINPKTGKVFHEKYEQANLGITMTGDFAPFDSSTGNLAAIPLSLEVNKDSVLTDLPALQRINQKIKKWERYGLACKPLPNEVKLLAPGKVDLVVDQSTITTKSTLLLQFGIYDLVLESGSWIHLEKNQCNLQIQLIGSKEMADESMLGFQAYLKNKLGDGLGETLGSKVTQSFRKKNFILADGRLAVPMTLTGELGDLEVKEELASVLEEMLVQLILPGAN